MGENKLTCPNCGVDELTPKVEHCAYLVNGKEVSYQSTYYACLNCGAEITSPAQSVANLEAMRLAKSKT